MGVSCARFAKKKNPPSKEEEEKRPMTKIPVPAAHRIHSYPRPPRPLHHSRRILGCLVSGFPLASDGHFVPLARHHPMGHGVGPSRRGSDVVFLSVAALEVLNLHHHLHHQPVVETDNPQKRLLPVRSIADEQLQRGKRVATQMVFVEPQDVVLEPQDQGQVLQRAGNKGP